MWGEAEAGAGPKHRTDGQRGGPAKATTLDLPLALLVAYPFVICSRQPAPLAGRPESWCSSSTDKCGRNPVGGNETRIALGPAGRQAQAICRQGGREEPSCSVTANIISWTVTSETCLLLRGTQSHPSRPTSASGLRPNNVDNLVPLGCVPRRGLCSTNVVIPSHLGLLGVRNPAEVDRALLGVGPADLTPSFQSRATEEAESVGQAWKG